MRYYFSKHPELFIISLGIVEVVVVVIVCWGMGNWNWQTPLTTGVIVFASHGVLIRYTRHRRTAERNAIIQRARDMLKDQIHNRLALISTSLYLIQKSPHGNQQRVERIQNAVDEISEVVDNLSEDTVERWNSN